MGTITRSFANLIGANGPTALPSGVGGKVLQVVQTSITSTTSVTSNSFVDVGLSLAITPSNSSNKILVICAVQAGVPEAGASGDDGYIAVARDINGGGYNRIGGGGNIEGNSLMHITAGSNSASYNDLQWILQTGTITYLDSPSTTSSTTYKIQQRNRNTSKQTYFNRRGGDNMSGISYLTLMEIAG